MSNTDFQFPVVIGPSGAVPTPPATIQAEIIAQVSATNPGYTVLPAGLIEDVLDTQVAGISEIDQARVDAINSLTPLGANQFTLAQLGQIYIGPGTAPGVPTNTSVYVQFSAVDESTSAALAGQVIPIGFTVSDGTFQYVVQDGGVTASDGATEPLYCLAINSGQWAVPENTVTQTVTQPPPNVIITCTNPSPGTSGAVSETAEEYAARVLQAGQAVCGGLATILKTYLGQVPGVQQRLVSVIQQGGAWEVIVGGGDPYEVAFAIMQSGVNIAGLVGSTLGIMGITNSNPGVITTDLNHGYATGQECEASGIVGMTTLNAVPMTALVITEKTFYTFSQTTAAVTITEASPAVVEWPSAAPANGTPVTFLSGALPAPLATDAVYYVVNSGVPSGNPDYSNIDTSPTGSGIDTTTAGGAFTALLGIDTTSFPAYVSGGELEPNLRNVSPSLSDQPNVYTIPFVVPPSQALTMTVAWNTTEPNFVSQAAVVQLAAPAIADYVNGILVGQPISLVYLGTTFVAAVASVLDAPTISELAFTIYINGVETGPIGESQLVFGDPESYFTATTAGIAVEQG